MEGLLSGGHWAALEREAQMEGLLREADRQTRTDRGSPRWDRLEELNAEARGPKEGKRKAGTLKKLSDSPTKGSLMNLENARKRRLVKPRSSPPRAERPTAVLESRPLLVSRRKEEEAVASTDRDRSRGSREPSGKRLITGRSRNRTWFRGTSGSAGERLKVEERRVFGGGPNSLRKQTCGGRR